MIENLNPRLKIAIALVISYSSFALISKSVLLCNYILIMILFLVIKNKDGAIAILKYASVLFGLIFISEFVVHGVIFEFVGIGSLFILKISVFGIMIYWIQSNMKTGHFIVAMQAIHLPKSVIISFAVILRFIPTLKIEMKEISNAMKLRGIQFSLSNIVRRPAKTIEYAAIPLIMRSMTVSEQLSAASMSRGLDLYTKRSSYIDLKFTAGQVIFAIITIFIILMNVYLDKTLSSGGIII